MSTSPGGGALGTVVVVVDVVVELLVVVGGTVATGTVLGGAAAGDDARLQPTSTVIHNPRMANVVAEFVLAVGDVDDRVNRALGTSMRPIRWTACFRLAAVGLVLALLPPTEPAGDG